MTGDGADIGRDGTTEAGRGGALAGAFWEERDALYRYALRHLRDPSDAEDAVHDAFIRLSTGAPRAVASPRAWMFRVLRNLCVDRLRRARRRDAQPEAEIAVSLHAAGAEIRTAEAELATSEALARAAAAIERLPREEAQVLTLKVAGGLSYEEIAYLTDASIGAVRARLHRARKLLRGLVDEDAAPTPRPGAKRHAAGPGKDAS